jgi:hypothetical protein
MGFFPEQQSWCSSNGDPESDKADLVPRLSGPDSRPCPAGRDRVAGCLVGIYAAPKDATHAVGALECSGLEAPPSSHGDAQRNSKAKSSGNGKAQDSAFRVHTACNT